MAKADPFLQEIERQWAVLREYGSSVQEDVDALLQRAVTNWEEGWTRGQG